MSISQDIFTTYKNRSETWIAKNFPEFHSFIFSSFTESISWREKLYLYSEKRNGKPTCKCGNGLKFIDIIKGYRKYCSNKCKSNDIEFKQSVEQTNLRKLGVTNPMRSNVVKRKHKEKRVQNWGVENVSKLDSIKEKVKKTNRDKFGKDYKSQTFDAKRLLSKRMQLNSKILNNSKNEFLKLKLVEKFKGLGLEFIEIISSSRYQAKCVQEHIFEIHKTTLNDRIRNSNRICTVCNPVESGSDAQFELFEFISSFYQGNLLLNYRGFRKYELDIYLPEIGLAFEYNGLYWHSFKMKDKQYHCEKKNYFSERGIDIINIWEDDWIYRKFEIKQRIIDIFNPVINAYENKIYSTSDCFLLFFLKRGGFVVDRISNPIFEFVRKNERIKPNFTEVNFDFTKHKLVEVGGIWNIGIHRLIYREC